MPALLYKEVEGKERLHIVNNIVESTAQNVKLLARNTCIKFLESTH